MSAALVSALAAQDEFLTFPPWATSEWSEDEAQEFFDMFGESDGVPGRDAERYKAFLVAGHAGAAGAGAAAAAEEEEEEEELWPWATPGAYCVGAPHRLIYGNTRPLTNPSATFRVFCFLWTGGCASFFGRLQKLFADSPIELVPINLPGRDKDAETGPADSWKDAVGQLTDALADGWVQAMPYAFFGHSLGAWTAIETLHALRNRNGAGPALPLPVHLFVSAKFAPQLAAEERIHALAEFRKTASVGAASDLGSADAPKVASADTETFWEFNAMYGLDVKLSSSAFFRSSFEKIFRADLVLSEGYNGCDPHAGQCAVQTLMVEGVALRCGITVMG